MRTALRRALPALALLLAMPAWSGPFGFGKKRQNDADAEAESAGAPEGPIPAGLEAAAALFGTSLPLDPGPLPDGLANASAQGCAGCHWSAVETWSASAHAVGPSPGLIAAAADANSPACLSCHLPLRPQHRDLVVHDGGSPDAPHTGPNVDFDATLSIEGVTCAACHMRDGHIVGPEASAVGPHAGRWSLTLSESTACASCHQLSWPGATEPLYDTFGEWQRSAYSQAGVQCQDCHLRPGADGGAVSHDVSMPVGRALSVLVALPPQALVRGGEGQTATITLQNTGAGHAIPTGSPFRGLRVTVAVEGPAAKGDGRATWSEPLVVDLARTVGDAAPWPITADTRLQAGAQRALTLDVSLPVDAPRGDYALITSLTDVSKGEPDGEPHVVQRIPLRIQ